MFVYGDVVYAQIWQVLTLKNCMEPFSYASAAYVVASALVSVRLFCKNLGNLQKFFGQMVNPPPPRAKKSPYAHDFTSALRVQIGSLFLITALRYEYSILTRKDRLAIKLLC